MMDGKQQLTFNSVGSDEDEETAQSGASRLNSESSVSSNVSTPKKFFHNISNLWSRSKLYWFFKKVY